MAAVLCTIAAVGGCSAPARCAGFERLATLPAGDPITADNLYPSRTAEWSYAVTAGTDAGDSITHRRADTKRFDATWVDHEDDRISEFQRRDNHGNIVMPAVISHRDHTISLFEPPLIIAYQALPAGQPRRQEVAMRVVDLSDTAQLRESGRAVQTIEYVDDQRLRTALGEFTAKRVIVTFNADLQFAHAQTSSTLYVVPVLGAIVQQRREEVRILGIPTRNR
ncbi:MAG: hypothetical protein O6933_07045, partial [Planctomycetota bacterium]|nr:hypothetical protein [Planctomycetota bacterium]